VNSLPGIYAGEQVVNCNFCFK